MLRVSAKQKKAVYLGFLVPAHLQVACLPAVSISVH